MSIIPFFRLLASFWLIWDIVSAFQKYEQEMVMQPTSLSITSIVYNPSAQQSKWIRRVFGEEAIFHNRSTPSKSVLSLSPEEKIERLELFRNHFRLPPQSVNPSCSFEMLGYVVADVGEPLTFASLQLRPAIGTANLRIGKNENVTWVCYYRAMYDNNFMKIKMKPYHHWPVFIYCPAPFFERSCRNLVDLYRQHYTGPWKTLGVHDLLGVKPSSVRLGLANFDVTPPHMNYDTFSKQRQDPNEFVSDSNKNKPEETILMPSLLEMELESVRWEVPLQIDLFNMQRKPKNSKGMAVCVAIPYLSSSNDKIEINSVMMFEFIRHYSNLGFKVMIYDRLGRNYQHIFSHPYVQRYLKNVNVQEDTIGSGSSAYAFPNTDLNFRYYNYTMLQKLGGYRFDIRYENTLGLSAAVLYTDIDKQLTYTHCRFAVKHLYAIENVLVADFDEFLYCPRSKGSFTSQKSFVHDYFKHMNTKGIEQLYVKQRVLVSKTKNMGQCMMQQINSVKEFSRTSKSSPLVAPAILTKDVVTNPTLEEASIFHCLAPYHYGVRTYFDKTMLFGHHCPFTSYHYSSYKRQYDCFALSYISATKRKRNYSTGGCGLVHITTRNATYNRSHSHNVDAIYSKPNELYYITNQLDLPI